MAFISGNAKCSLMASSTPVHVSTLVKKRRKELVRLCMDLISADTQNPPGDTRRAVGIAKDFLHDADCRSRVVGITKQKANLVTAVGNKYDRIVFCSHLDVVPIGDAARWKRNPFKPYVKARKIFGRGAADAKGSAAAMLMAISILASDFEPQLASKGIMLALVCDEEIGGRKGAKWLIENRHVQGSACLIGEPSYVSQDLARIVIGERGLAWFHFTSRGRPAHASMPQLGENAIMRILPVLSAIDDISRIKRNAPAVLGNAVESSRQIMQHIARQRRIKSGGLSETIDHYSVNVATIHGGTKTNVVPDLCETEVDVRIPIGGSVREARRFVQRIMPRGVDVNIVNKSEPSFTAEREWIVRSAHKATQAVLRREVSSTIAPYTSDAHWFRELLSIPTCTFGPGYEFHVYNESLPIKQLLEAAAVYVSAALPHYST